MMKTISFKIDDVEETIIMKLASTKASGNVSEALRMLIRCSRKCPVAHLANKQKKSTK